MWCVQILWNDVWVTVQRGFASKDDAEWCIGKWKQRNNMTADPFRAFDADPDREDAHADQRAEDEAVYQNELRQQLANRV